MIGDGPINTALEGASGFGGEVWIASLVIISAVVLLALYIYKVAIPNRMANQHLAQTLGDAVAAIGHTAGTTLSHVEITREDVGRIKGGLKVLVKVVGKLQAAKDLSEVDLAEEIGEVKGALGN
jgi:hypothetical protein